MIPRGNTQVGRCCVLTNVQKCTCTGCGGFISGIDQYQIAQIHGVFIYGEVFSLFGLGIIGGRSILSCNGDRYYFFILLAFVLNGYGCFTFSNGSYQTAIRYRDDCSIRRCVGEFFAIGIKLRDKGSNDLICFVYLHCVCALRKRQTCLVIGGRLVASGIVFISRILVFIGRGVIRLNGGLCVILTA